MRQRTPVGIRAAWIAIFGVVILAIATLSVPFVEHWLTKRNSPPAIEYIGRVIDGNSQQPIVGAKITLDLQGVPPIVYTDSEGIYRFRLSSNSDISGTVRVDAQGYQPYTRIITLSSNNKALEDIRLTPQNPVPTRGFPLTESVACPTVTDTFDLPQFNMSLWQPPITAPIDAPIVSIENGQLIFRVTPQQATGEVDARLEMAPQARPISEVALTMTMISYARSSQGGVSARVLMSDGTDHYVAITHDHQNTAIEFGICLKAKCNEDYAAYKHAQAIHTQENNPVQIKLLWDGFELALYANGVKRDAAPAQNNPIMGFDLSLYSEPGSAFELAVDDVAITYSCP